MKLQSHRKEFFQVTFKNKMWLHISTEIYPKDEKNCKIKKKVTIFSNHIVDNSVILKLLFRIKPMTMRYANSFIPGVTENQGSWHGGKEIKM